MLSSDHIALPSKGGAMENWGLITYGEESLCVSGTSPATGRLNVGSIIAHELAHQVCQSIKDWNWKLQAQSTLHDHAPHE